MNHFWNCIWRWSVSKFPLGFLILVFFICPKVHAWDSTTSWNPTTYFWNLKNNSQETKTGLVQTVALNHSFQSLSSQAEIDVRVWVRDVSIASEIPIALGKNNYIQTEILGWNWILGRKEKYQKNSHIEWFDGGEGLATEWIPNPNFSLRLWLYDYYRGFPLWEKQITPIVNSQIPETGNRMRQSLEMEYEWGHFSLQGEYSLLRLGNWGKTSKDIPDRTGIGDGDFLHKKNVQFVWDNESTFFLIAFSKTKGMDKTFSNPQLKERTIPVQGERISGGGGIRYQDWTVSFHVFLPDSAEINSQGEVIGMGSVETGSNPFGGTFLSRERNFYPSAWITPQGWEKSKDFVSGRTHSFWSSFQLVWNQHPYRWTYTLDYVMPRSLQESKGQISVQKRDYQSHFWVEHRAQLEFWNSWDRIRMGIDVSFLFSSQTPKDYAQSVMFWGSIQL